MTTDNYSESLNSPARRGVEHHTAADTLKTGESGTIHTNKGAAGTIALTLPPALPGMQFFFYIGAAQILQIEPSAGEKVSLPSSGVAEAADDYIAADAIGETVHLMCCETGIWSVFGYTGTWTGQ